MSLFVPIAVHARLFHFGHESQVFCVLLRQSYFGISLRKVLFRFVKVFEPFSRVVILGSQMSPSMYFYCCIRTFRYVGSTYLLRLFSTCLLKDLFFLSSFYFRTSYSSSTLYFFFILFLYSLVSPSYFFHPLILSLRHLVSALFCFLCETYRRLRIRINNQGSLVLPAPIPSYYPRSKYVVLLLAFFLFSK